VTSFQRQPSATAALLEHHEARTWSHTDFHADDLLAQKKADGLTVSVVIPARNEEATVGRVVSTLRSALVDEVPLVDELVVIDGHSSDRTAEVAARAGAEVVDQTEVLAEFGPGSGKGEALWKGLSVTGGDLVVFVDADIHDIGPRFVTGLLGPLLTEADISFVKASYDRPFRAGEALLPEGGGRVTELLARPLLATFWPELAWLSQPLSGEYAGRRDLLQSVPFVQGYGVELALLIDIVEARGTAAIAQVDLGRRVHEHQPLHALSRMAAEILHVAMARLQRAGRASFRDPLGAMLAQPGRRDDGVLRLDSHAVGWAERPPLSSLSATPPKGPAARRR